jgi:hypothetical protein
MEPIIRSIKGLHSLSGAIARLPFAQANGQADGEAPDGEARVEADLDAVIAAGEAGEDDEPTAEASAERKGKGRRVTWVGSGRADCAVKPHDGTKNAVGSRYHSQPNHHSGKKGGGRGIAFRTYPCRCRGDE